MDPRLRGDDEVWGDFFERIEMYESCDLTSKLGDSAKEKW